MGFVDESSVGVAGWLPHRTNVCTAVDDATVPAATVACMDTILARGRQIMLVHIYIVVLCELECPCRALAKRIERLRSFRVFHATFTSYEQAGSRLTLQTLCLHGLLQQLPPSTPPSASVPRQCNAICDRKIPDVLIFHIVYSVVPNYHPDTVDIVTSLRAVVCSCLIIVYHHV